jgi:hypothetical protein
MTTKKAPPVVELVKVGSQSRDRRRSTDRGTQRYPTVFTWSAFVDKKLVMDGCSTRGEAKGYADAYIAGMRAAGGK